MFRVQMQIQHERLTFERLANNVARPPKVSIFMECPICRLSHDAECYVREMTDDDMLEIVERLERTPCVCAGGGARMLNERLLDAMLGDKMDVVNFASERPASVLVDGQVMQAISYAGGVQKLMPTHPNYKQAFRDIVNANLSDHKPAAAAADLYAKELDDGLNALLHDLCRQENQQTASDKKDRSRKKEENRK